MPVDPRPATSGHLQRSEARLRTILDRHGCGLFRSAWDGTILECNEAVARLLGLPSAASLIGQSILPFYAESQSRSRLLERLASGDDVTRNEVYMRRQDGTGFWALITVVAVTNETGEPEIEGMAIDITEWRRTTEALLDSEALLRGVVRTAGSAIVYLDRMLRVGEINPAAERMFGVPRERAIGRAYPEFFPPGVRPKIESDLHRILAGASITDFENAIAGPNGDTTVVLWNIDVLRDGMDCVQGIVLVGQDITSRQRAEEAMLRQARYLRTLTAADRGILAAQRPEEVASSMLHQLGSLLPYRGAAVTALDPDPVSPRLLARVGACAAPDLAGRTDAGVAPWFDRDQSASVRWLRLPLAAHDGPLGVLHIEQADDGAAVPAAELEIAGQVADRLAVALRYWHMYRQAEEARQRLAALSTSLVDAQEDERRRLARELHDEIGQALTGLLLRLESGLVGGPAEAARLVRELIADVRNLSLDLRPSILDDLGLLPALLWHVERFSRQVAIRVDFQHEGIDRRFAPRIETAAYRIVQEALTNVARHAGVSSARVRISAADTVLRLEIEDDGAGFDLRTVEPSSLGLSGMRERAVLLGGRFAVRASPGAGTAIEAELPADVLPPVPR